MADSTSTPGRWRRLLGSAWLLPLGVTAVLVALYPLVLVPWMDRRVDDRVDEALADGEVDGDDGGEVLSADVEKALSSSATRRPCDAVDTSTPTVDVGATLPGYRLVELGRFDQPMYVVAHPALPVDLVLERAGRVLAGPEDATVVLDLSDVTRAEHDGGLLAGTYDPDGSWLYLYRSSRTDEGRQSTVLTAHPVDPDTGLPLDDEPVELLEMEQPTAQHDGGGLAFGPDGMLWLSTGDGGGLGDPWPNAQDPASLLGKLLRIDPDPAAGTYVVPPDNPDPVGRDDHPEIFAMGLRNPWRLTFDEITGTLFLPDAGQTCWEEVNVVNFPAEQPGLNFGWDVWEGTHPFQTAPVKPDDEPEYTDPFVEFRHGAGSCAVTGGLVYRGAAMPELDGAFLHTDWCATDVHALRQDEEGRWSREPLGVGVRRSVAVVADHDGEPLVVELMGEEEGDPGAIYRIEPA